MKVGIIIQARMGSERLPGKVLRMIKGRSILETLIGRIKNCGLPIIIATTTKTADDVLVEKLKELKVNYFRGSEEDVLSRYYECALQNKLDVVIRLTADNPFIDSGLINETLEVFKEHENSNVYLATEKYPLGIGLEIFGFGLLEKAFKNARSIQEREHVTPYIINDPTVRKESFEYKVDRSNYRLTVDTEKDLELVDKLISEYKADELSIDEIIKIMDDHKELQQINSTVKQKKWNE